MKKYNVKIGFENGLEITLNNVNQVLIKENEIYVLKPIEEFITESKNYKPYAILGDKQRFDFIKYKDAVYTHYYE